MSTATGRIWVSEKDDLMQPRTWQLLRDGEKRQISAPLLLLDSAGTAKTCVTEGFTTLSGPLLWAAFSEKSTGDVMQLVAAREAEHNAERPARIKRKIRAFSAFLLLFTLGSAAPLYHSFDSSLPALMIFVLLNAMVFGAVAPLLARSDALVTPISARPSVCEVSVRFAGARENDSGDGWMSMSDGDGGGDGGDGGD